MTNAQWMVRGTDTNGQYISMYLMSPDLRDTKEAKKRAAQTAKDRWAKKGVVVASIADARCVG